MIINAEDFKPKEKGKSDFYSWNLYRWLRKNKGKECLIFETPREYIPLVIGWKDPHGNVIGFRLNELCSTGSNRKFPQQFCYGDQGWPDVTEEFYKEYDRIGVCAIHENAAHDWVYSVCGNLRSCKHCKKQESRVLKMIEQAYWVNA